MATAIATRHQNRPVRMAVNGANGVRAKHDFASMKVNQDRLMKNIHEGCEFGAAWRYGEYVSRSYASNGFIDTLLVIQQRRGWRGYL